MAVLAFKGRRKREYSSGSFYNSQSDEQAEAYSNYLDNGDPGPVQLSCRGQPRWCETQNGVGSRKRRMTFAVRRETLFW